jgi:hypothetical protein
MSARNHRDQIDDTIGRIAGEILRAKGTTRLIFAIIRNILSGWSGQSRLRKIIAHPLQKLFTKKKDKSKPSSASPLPVDLGRLITLLAAAINESHSDNIQKKTDARGDAIRAFLENTDFGEIREMVEGLDPHVLKAIEAFNGQLWNYPAKVGTLVATIIALLNMSVRASREVLLPIEQAIGPDLLADIILSIVKDLKGEDTGKLAHTLMEIIRRIHTGSLLLGKGGKPLFQIYLTDHLKDSFHQLDPDLLKKIRIILAEDREAIANAVSDALMDNPRLLMAYLSSIGSVKNSDIRTKSHKLNLVEGVDQQGLNTAICETMSDLDTYEIAELVNTVFRVINHIHDAKPDIVHNLVSGVVDSINHEEVRKTAQWLIPDLVEAFRPLATTLMPMILKGLCEIIRPDAGGESEEYIEAMETLQATLAMGNRG